MLARIVTVSVLLVALAGCAADSVELRLVDTKSVAQLLRNEAWDRLPELMIKEDVETTDQSEACDSDPEGRLRFWRSSTIAALNNSFAPRVISLADQLAVTFTEQGWTATRTEVDGSVLTVLSRIGSPATIEIVAMEKTPDRRASVQITTTGPCVQTAGAASDEVVSLEHWAR